MKETLAKGAKGYFTMMMKASVHVPKQGHGYPAYNHEYWELLEFYDDDEVVAFIKKNHETLKNKEYHIIYCAPVKVKIETGVTVTIE
jgi:hypothetical protein